MTVYPQYPVAPKNGWRDSPIRVNSRWSKNGADERVRDARRPLTSTPTTNRSEAMGESICGEATGIAAAEKCDLPLMLKCLELAQVQEWKYETDEFRGVCEIARDDMVVKCIFRTTDRAFYDVLGIDGAIRFLLCQPTSVERLCQSLADYFPSLSVTVMGRADTHGWITSTITRRHN